MAGIIKVNQYQDFNGNTLFTSDGSGNLTTQEILYPAFEAYLSATQNVTSATATKVQFDTEVFDEGGVYDSSTNYRFTPTVAGKYYVYAGLQCYGSAFSSLERAHIQIYKNGSIIRDGWNDLQNNDGRFLSPCREATLPLTTSDYVEIYTIIENSSGTPQLYSAAGTEQGNYFGAYRIGS